jgi:hypothetical protein
MPMVSRGANTNTQSEQIIRNQIHGTFIEVVYGYTVSMGPPGLFLAWGCRV